MKENAVIIDGVKHTLVVFTNHISNLCGKCSLKEHCYELDEGYPGFCDMFRYKGKCAYFEILKEKV